MSREGMRRRIAGMREEFEREMRREEERAVGELKEGLRGVVAL